MPNTVKIQHAPSDRCTVKVNVTNLTQRQANYLADTINILTDPAYAEAQQQCNEGVLQLTQYPDQVHPGPAISRN